jgi:L-ascorbate 6-phosphate lactonase
MGSVTVRWLGQSGYAIHSSDGELCLVDPYLSDWAEQDIGTRRIVAPPVSVEELEPRLVVCTHWHHDHLDRPTVRALTAANPDTTFVGPPSNTARLLGDGVAAQRIVELRDGEVARVGEYSVEATFARHAVPGWLTEDAIGVVIAVDGVRIYHSGDTEYDGRLLPIRDRGPLDLALVASNGSGGNLNAKEAALLAHQLEPALAIPNHYGMWADEDYGPGATLDPAVFVETCGRLGGPQTRVLELGEAIELR